jgi:hypothetical protein
MRAVEKICCGLGYLKIALCQSLITARTVTFRSEILDGGTPCWWNISQFEEHWQTKKREEKVGRQG